MKKKTSKHKRDFISIADLTAEELGRLLLLSLTMEKRRFSRRLAGRTIGLIFQKPSTRTAVSFAVGVVQLGGHPLILSADTLQIKRGESPRDTGRVLSRYLDAIVIRADRHEDILEMAGFADIPVINGLTDREHPCQVLADVMTIMQTRRLKHPKELRGFRITYVGDGNNMAHSWMLAASLLGMNLRVSTPEGYGPRQEYVDRSKALTKGKPSVELVRDPVAAVKDADAVYTDVWASMGQEAESSKRRVVFAPYQLNSGLLQHAKKDAMIMHCLPAHRGEEITENILEGAHSVVFQQAENRLHVQKAVLSWLLAGSAKR